MSRFSSDLDRPIIKPQFAVRGAYPIPSADIFDTPTYCFEINAEWLPHILGALDVLDQPDAWEGTEADIEAARDQIRKLMAANLCP